MKKNLIVILIAFSFIFIYQVNVKGDWNFNPKLKLNSGKDFSKEKLKRDYDNAMKEHQKIAGTLLGASIDFMIGYGVTSPDINEQPSKGTYATSSKGGITLGALVNINILEIIKFSTGVDFINKKYDVGIPSILNPSTDSVTQEVSNSYLNIPMNIYFGGMITEKIGLSFSGGPYFGILLNPENALTGFKDFDLGLNGILTWNYVLNVITSVILGTQVQYGGLNNLLSTSNVESVHTFNWNAFTGLRVGF